MRDAGEREPETYPADAGSLSDVRRCRTFHLPVHRLLRADTSPNAGLSQRA
jgi:hypothetical protein